jgi:hypothetical protein
MGQQATAVHPLHISLLRQLGTGHISYMKSIALVTVLALLLTGCAAIQRANRQNTERVLSAAGFKPHPANTAERQQSLAALTPYAIERKLRGNDFYYVYGDPEQNIVYIGNQEAYSKYLQIRLQQQIASENMAAAQMNMSAAQQWNDWAFWGPVYLLPPPRMRGYL